MTNKDYSIATLCQQGTMDASVKGIESSQCVKDNGSHGSDHGDEILQRDWSDDEEQRAKRKLVLLRRKQNI